MAKWKRTVVGSVLKPKDGNSGGDYIKFSQDVVFKKGTTLKLESKKQQLENLQGAASAGKLSADQAESIKERLEKIPDFVRFEVVHLEKQGE